MRQSNTAIIFGRCEQEQHHREQRQQYCWRWFEEVLWDLLRVRKCRRVDYCPSCASSPLRGKEHLSKCNLVVVESRSASDGQLLDGDIYFFIDSSRHSEATFSSAFGPPDTRPKLTKNQLFVTLLQGSIQRRRELSRGYGQLDQLQTIHMFTGSPLKIVEQDRLVVAN